MQAVTVVPGRLARRGSTTSPSPRRASDRSSSRPLAVGICGTDAEIAGGDYGWAPPGEERLVLGHESLGRVLDPGPTGLAVGDHVVGIVRRPDPVPCPNCAVGEWDMCSNGRYTERGIKEVARVHVRALADRAGVRGPSRPEPRLPRGPPGTDHGRRQGVGADPDDRTAERSGTRSTVLVVGAGPIGLLAALIGVQRGLEVHVLDRVTHRSEAGVWSRLGCHLPHRNDRGPGVQPGHRRRVHRRRPARPASAAAVRPGGIVCLTGVGAPSTATLGAASTLPPMPCSRTWCCSARSTPIAATTTGRRRCSPEPTGPGSNNSSPRRAGPTMSTRPWPGRR